MNRLLAAAVLIGATLVSAALVYHGRALRQVAVRLQAMEKQTGELDGRLEKLSKDLPVLVGDAGKEAGRQAVHGVIEEAIQKPFNQLAPRLAAGASDVVSRVAGVLDGESPRPNGAGPLIQFSIPSPIVTIEIATDFKELPFLPSRPRPEGQVAGAATNEPRRAPAPTVEAGGPAPRE